MTLAETIATGRELKLRYQAEQLAAEDYEELAARLVGHTPDGTRWRYYPRDGQWRWGHGDRWLDPEQGYLQRGFRSALTFAAAETASRLALEARARGQLTDAALEVQLKGLRVQDAEGRWWEMARGSETWYCWLDGKWQSPEELASRATAPEQVVPTTILAVPQRHGERRGDAHVLTSLLCATCSRLRDGLACEAFPDGIPEVILTGRWDHWLPYLGDGGQRYHYIHDKG